MASLTFHSGPTDLVVMILGVPHHQVGQAPAAVSKVHSQAPAHATEDTAPQAGDKILNTEDMVTSHPLVTGPEDFSGHEMGTLRHHTLFCCSCWGPRTTSHHPQRVTITSVQPGKCWEQLRKRDLGIRQP